MSHKVSFEVRNVAIVGVGKESFTKGTVYDRTFSNAIFERLSALKDNGFIKLHSDLKLDDEADEVTKVVFEAPPEPEPVVGDVAPEAVPEEVPEVVAEAVPEEKVESKKTKKNPKN